MYNKSELARRFNCDPRTIDRYIKIHNGELIPKPSSRVYQSKLDGFKDVIIDKVDKYGCSAMGVYKFIQKKGYQGKYSILAEFVKNHKTEEVKKATIRFETNPGLQAQVDWKEDMTLVNRNGMILLTSAACLTLVNRIKVVKKLHFHFGILQHFDIDIYKSYSTHIFCILLGVILQ